MSNRRPFLRLLAFVPWLWLFSPGKAMAAKDSQPPCQFAWDDAERGTILTQDFLITQRELYLLRFSFDYVAGDRSDRVRALNDFVGDGTMQRVSPETADSDDPVPVEMFSPEDQAFMDAGGRISRKQISAEQGVETLINRDGSIHKEQPYVIPPFVTRYTKKGAGVTIPLHIRIERLTDGAATIVYDETAQTTGSVTLGKRSICAVTLDRGAYRLTTRLLGDSVIPSNIKVNLELSWNPKFSPI
jgi:hypothetical protein